jgi:hypothetical protein
VGTGSVVKKSVTRGGIYEWSLALSQNFLVQNDGINLFFNILCHCDTTATRSFFANCAFSVNNSKLICQIFFQSKIRVGYFMVTFFPL